MFLSRLFKNARSKVMIALAGLTMVFGTAAAITTAAVAQENEVVETKAVSASTFVYFKASASSGWAAPFIHCWNGSKATSEPKPMIGIGAGYFYYDVGTCTGCLFCTDSGYSNKTGDLRISSPNRWWAQSSGNSGSWTKYTGFTGSTTLKIEDRSNTFDPAEAVLRFYLKADNGEEALSPVYSPSYVSSTNKRIFDVTFPAVPSGASSWILGIGLRYKPEYSSDTTINWDHKWNQTDDLDLPAEVSHPFWYTTGATTYTRTTMPADFSGFAPGDPFYFEPGGTAKQDNGNWAIYFYGIYGDTQDQWINVETQGRKVLGTGGDYSNGLWEFTIPTPSSGSGTENMRWHNYIVVELKSGQTTPSWDNKQQQSGNLTYNGSTNVIKGFSDSDYSVSDSTRATYFANYFNAQTDGKAPATGVCKSDGSTSAAALTTAWTNVTNQFPLFSGPCSSFKNSAANPSGTALQQAAARYDYIVGKYGKTDFASRKGTANYSYSGLAVVVPSPKESPLTMTLWIVLGSGLAGLAAIGTAYFVSKKKKRYNA